MSLVVLQNPDLDGARCTVHIDSLPEWTARGWEVVGPAMQMLSTVTVDEQRAADEAATAAAAALAEAHAQPEPEPDADEADGAPETEAVPDGPDATPATQEETPS